MPVTKGVNTISTITTLNTKEILKNEFYITSPNLLPTIISPYNFKNCLNNFNNLYNMLNLEGIRTYLLEYPIVITEKSLETFRKENYSSYPSRLNSIFAFLNFDHAKNFKGKYIYKAKINTATTYKVTVHNMEEISALRGNNPIATPLNYWTGYLQEFSYPDSFYPVKKEVLIDGEILLELIYTK